MANVLEDAQRLYNEGRWPEVIQAIEQALGNLTEDREIAEANRIKGWSWYYIGIKGSPEEKNISLDRSKACFEVALVKTLDRGGKISIMNGLPLTMWNLGEKKKAWEINNQAIEEFPEEPSVWNTRSILCRWAKDFNQSVEVCEKVYETAITREEYRIAGHGKHNKADALNELGWKEMAREEYKAAIVLYRKFEEVTGESAAFHIEGVEKKLANL